MIEPSLNEILPIESPEMSRALARPLALSVEICPSSKRGELSKAFSASLLWRLEDYMGPSDYTEKQSEARYCFNLDSKESLWVDDRELPPILGVAAESLSESAQRDEPLGLSWAFKSGNWREGGISVGKATATTFMPRDQVEDFLTSWARSHLKTYVLVSRETSIASNSGNRDGVFAAAILELDAKREAMAIKTSLGSIRERANNAKADKKLRI